MREWVTGGRFRKSHRAGVSRHERRIFSQKSRPFPQYECSVPHLRRSFPNFPKPIPITKASVPILGMISPNFSVSLPNYFVVFPIFFGAFPIFSRVFPSFSGATLIYKCLFHSYLIDFCRTPTAQDAPAGQIQPWRASIPASRSAPPTCGLRATFFSPNTSVNN